MFKKRARRSLFFVGLLLLVACYLLPRFDRIGPLIRYQLLGLGSTPAAKAELAQEIAAIAERISERQGETPLSAAPDFTWPTPGWGEITSSWGERSHPILQERQQHLGIDIGAPKGADVLAIGAGEVILVAEFKAYGRVVVIDHGGGWASVYAHLAEAAVKEGEWVVAGERIGAVGATGRVTGAHLHLELHRQGEAIDPLEQLRIP